MMIDVENAKVELEQLIERAGLYEGQIWIADDFDESPEDMFDVLGDDTCLPNTGGDRRGDG